MNIFRGGGGNIVGLYQLVGSGCKVAKQRDGPGLALRDLAPMKY